MNVKKIIKYLCLITLLILVCILIYYKQIFVVKLKTTTFSHEETVNIDFNAYFKGKNVTNEVTVEKGTFDGVVGRYEVTFIYWNNGNKYKSIKKISIVDTVSPQIKLIGGDKVIVTKGDNYQELGFSAIDNYDGDLKNKVEVTGEVNTSKVGIYKVTYTVRDSSGNQTKVIREVEVALKSPLEMSIKDFTLDELFTDSILVETETANLDYFNKILFIGDSSVLNYNSNKSMALYSRNIDLNNDINTQLKVIQTINRKNPDAILISFDSNKLKDLNLEIMIEKYNSFIEEIKNEYPNMKIIIQSYLPVLENNVNVNNDNINKANYYLANLCSQSGIKFLNVAASLKDENGYCSTINCNDNSLTDEGRKVLIDYLLTHQYKED